MNSEEILKGIKEGEGLEIVKNLDLSKAEDLKGKFEGLDVIIHLAANGILFLSFSHHFYYILLF